MVSDRLKYALVIVVYIFLFMVLIYGLMDIMKAHSCSDLNETQNLSRSIQTRILLAN